VCMGKGTALGKRDTTLPHRQTFTRKIIPVTDKRLDEENIQFRVVVKFYDNPKLKFLGQPAKRTVRVTNRLFCAVCFTRNPVYTRRLAICILFNSHFASCQKQNKMTLGHLSRTSHLTLLKLQGNIKLSPIRDNFASSIHNNKQRFWYSSPTELQSDKRRTR
jgi:hypothetical protein